VAYEVVLYYKGSVFLVDPEHDVREEPWGLLDINLLWTCLSTDMHGM